MSIGIYRTKEEDEEARKKYKENLYSEYWQVKGRLNRLHNVIVKYATDTLPFRSKCSIELLAEQEEAMQHYLFILEVRAEYEGIDLSCNRL